MVRVLLLVLFASALQPADGPALARFFVATSAGSYKSYSWGEQWQPERGLPPAVRAFACFGPLVFAGGAAGLNRSDDWGDSWRPVAAWSGGEIVSFVGSSFFPLDPVLFAGTRDGLYRSRDSGDRWERVGSRDVRGTVSQLLWVGAALHAVSANGVYVSEDGGETWRALDAGLPKVAPLSLALSQYYGVDPVGFVGTAGRGVYRTRDGGKSFAAVGGEMLASRTVYSLSWWGEFLFAGTDQGLFISRDAGESWRSTSVAGLDGAKVFTIAIPAAGTPLPSDVLLGTDRGVWKSSDAGSTWRALKEKLGTPAVFGFGFFPFPKDDVDTRREP